MTTNNNYSQPINQTILLADDDNMSRMLMKKSLANSGYQIIDAADGLEAWQLFQQNQVDLCIIDVIMPEKDGFELCKLIRSHKFGEHIPILIITGLDDIDSISKAYEAGATDFLTKPINWLLLKHRVKYILRSYQMFELLQNNEKRLKAVQKISKSRQPDHRWP